MNLSSHGVSTMDFVTIEEGRAGATELIDDITRHIARKIGALGDTTTLAEPNVVAAFKRKYEDRE